MSEIGNAAKMCVSWRLSPYLRVTAMDSDSLAAYDEERGDRNEEYSDEGEQALCPGNAKSRIDKKRDR